MNFNKFLNVLLVFALLLFVGDKVYSLFLRTSGDVKAAPEQENLRMVGNAPTTNGGNYLAIPAAAFQPGNDLITFYNTGDLLYPNSTSPFGNMFYAPVYLPNGVTVSKVIFYWRDFSTLDATVTIKRSILEFGSSEFMANVSSNGNSGLGNSETEMIDHSTIDNYSYSYFLELYLPYQDVTHGTSAYTVFIQYEYMTYLPVTIKD